MNLRITVENAQKIEEGIWRAQLKPNEIRILGECSNNYGIFSVLLCESADYNETSKKITFDPKTIQLLNVGNTEETIILNSLVSSAIKETKEVEQIIPLTKEAKPEAIKQGDKDFIAKLPHNLQDLGVMLLTKVRENFRGELKYHTRSRKFVETPDNFWTVIIQPRDRSLRIIVRGTPDFFKGIHKLDLKPDMTGYSAFKISDKSQVSEAFFVIKQAAQK